ncbi:hypothetical protein GX51_05761 [Blastomyces parvus]|uniref:DUF7707 domain-containing protein n=1 Tax=Blastomyces parvus TaxID=2060905 RepID=A0A2B7WUS2_9EURO|nr:hypothetical protein GX51_05761 [Blastomyces parvus]
MLLSATVFALSLLVTGIRAQSFNPGSISNELKLSWCDAQTAACPSVCKSFASVNKCSVSDLTYTCTCGDGTTPDLTKYKSTIPYFICTESYAQCIQSHPDDLTGQRACKAEQAKCLGTLDPFKSPENGSAATKSQKQAATGASNPTPTKEPKKPKEPKEPKEPKKPKEGDDGDDGDESAASALHVAGDSSVGILVAVLIAASSLFA